MKTRSHQVAEIKFTARWDRDERGRFADVEVFDYPAWMSTKTVRAIEEDIAVDMREADDARHAGCQGE